MASRKRNNKSSLTRKDAGQKQDFPVAGRAKRADEGVVSPKYNTNREMKWDEEGKHLQTDRDYGSGSSVEHTGMEDDNTDPRPYNNYDDYDKTYPPSHR